MSDVQQFPALSTHTLRIGLTTAKLTVSVSDVADIHVIIQSKHERGIVTRHREGQLIVFQSLNPLHAVWEVNILLPRTWKGALHAHTVTGDIEVDGFSGTDVNLHSMTGFVHLYHSTCITAHLRSLTGLIHMSSSVCDACTVHACFALSGITACSFLTCRLLSLFAPAEVMLSEAFDRLRILKVSGKAMVYAPLCDADTSFHSIRGKLTAEGVASMPGAPRIVMHSVTAPLRLIRTSDAPILDVLDNWIQNF